MKEKKKKIEKKKDMIYRKEIRVEKIGGKEEWRGKVFIYGEEKKGCLM